MGSTRSGDLTGHIPREDGAQPRKDLARRTRSVFVTDDAPLIRRPPGRQLNTHGIELHERHALYQHLSSALDTVQTS